MRLIVAILIMISAIVLNGCAYIAASQDARQDELARARVLKTQKVESKTETTKSATGEVVNTKSEVTPTSPSQPVDANDAASRMISPLTQ